MLHFTDPVTQFAFVYMSLLIPALLSGLLLRALTTDLEGWDSFGKKVVKTTYYVLFVCTTVLLVSIINELEEVYKYSFEPISVLDKIVIVSLLQFVCFLITLRRT